MEEIPTTKGATISTCQRYRYDLFRIWDDQKDLIMFIGLNPSTADASIDDPTIRRCTQFAKDWGYGGLHMVNLFAWRSPSPQVLWLAEFPLEEKNRPGVNDAYLKQVAEKCTKIVFAWGNYGTLNERCYKVQKMFPDAFCFGLTTAGQPKHPLYLPAVEKLIPFSVDTPYIKKLDTKTKDEVFTNLK